MRYMPRVDQRVNTVILWAILALLLGCRGTAHNYPSDFLKAAALFKKADPTNRYEQALALVITLPKCNETMRVERPFSVLVSYDYSKPSYFLPEQDAIRFLGMPCCRTGASLTYPIAIEAGGEHKSVLTIQLMGSNVVGSLIHGN
jgi:hypothetical protein